MYQKKYFIGSNDVDQFLELKLASFFKMMQDIATEHAEVLNIGKQETIDKGLYWVIARTELDILSMPKYLTNVVLKTYPGDDLKMLFPRYFQLEDEQGNVLIKASTTWMVLNKETKRVCLNPFNGYKAPTEHYEGELHLPTKCASDETSKVEDRLIRYSDIDLNGHLNNTKYIEYVVDTHNSEFYKKHRISHFLINYHKELKDGEVLTLLTNNKIPEYVRGEVSGVLSLEVNIDYRDR